jgi:drug/metabolite transporter (DMT)-like permease
MKGETITMTEGKKGTRTIFYHLLAVIVVAIWGSTLVSTKILIHDGMRPDEIFLVRFIIAYIAIWAVSPKTIWANNLKDELLLAALGIMGGSLYFVIENVAVSITYVNNVSFIVCTSPLITTLLVFMLTKGMKMGKKLIMGSILALIGVAIVIFNGQCVLKLNPLGDMLAAATAVCWGVYCLLLKKLGNRYDPIFITRKVFFYGILTALPIFLFNPWEFSLAGFLQQSVWINLLFLGFVASFVCFALWSICINKLGAVTASNYNYLSPIATVLVCAIFLSEPMTAMAWVGSILILAGVFLANKDCPA